MTEHPRGSTFSGYIEFEVGVRGVEFIRDTLRQGHTFSKLLLDRLSASQGKVIAFLPDDVNIEKHADIQSGGTHEGKPTEKYVVGDPPFVMERTPGHEESQTWLVWQLRKYLRCSINALIVCENPLAMSKDPWLQRAQSRLRYFENEVYHVAFPEDRNLLIRKAVREADSPWIFAGAATCVPLELSLAVDRREFTYEDLEMLAAHAGWIFCHAYDGESYVIWKRIP